MILSASRRTDIPNYYSDWFYNRIKEGYLYVRNPFNFHQISKIDLSPNVIDCIVFWTKNPEPMIVRLDELSRYSYYFQFTLTGYGPDIEPNFPDKRNRLIHVFRELSGCIGSERVIWRYDPIFLNDKYTASYHLKAFKEIAEKLEGSTQRVVISFLDLYSKIKKQMEKLEARTEINQELLSLAGQMADIAKSHHMQIETCAEHIDLLEYGIAHGSCIDRRLIEQLIGCRLQGSKDKNQREECGCFESIEVGAYNTCLNGCRYCYANFNDKMVLESRKQYDVDSPLLCGAAGAEDVITIRNMKSLKVDQISFFD